MVMINYNEATIVDVREPSECRMGMVEGSLNIPLGDVPNMIEDFKKMKTPLIFCCRSGARSGQAVEFLKSHGLEDLHNGGSWQQVDAQLQ